MLYFLLTDIEGSTRRWEHDPAAMRVALGRHDGLMSEVVGSHDGRVFKRVGDGIWAVFETADDAVAAAVDAQRRIAEADWGDAGPLRIRAALHGVPDDEVEQREGDFLGPGLNRCARLVELAHPGQVVASDAVRLAASDPAAFWDLGAHRLRDLQEPEQVHQVLAPDLTVDFPPLRSPDAVPNNLPVQRTSFVGRAAELADLTDLVPRERLVTLTGPGGAGKSRLGLSAAAALVERFPDGVWLVDLSTVRDPTLVVSEVASRLGVREQTGRRLDDVLADWLRPRRLLLVVDNCEHLVDACAEVVDGLLSTCPDLHVLVTSRERLHLPGEQVRQVRPLSVDAGSEGDPSPPRGDAVELFVDRAAAVTSGFRPTTTDLDAVRAICARLDGIPLAIELAAARLPVLSPVELLARLDDRLRLLTGGRRASTPHQQTLRATLDWSHDLLDDRERVLFRRLAVFAEPVWLEAVEHVVSSGVLDDTDVLELLGGLVAKSLVDTDRTGSTTRYGMLETIREYAREQLEAAGETAALRDAHADWLLGQGELLRAARGESTLVPAAAAPIGDARQALEWLGETRPRDAVELASALSNRWFVTGQLGEARRHLERALERGDDVIDDGLRVRAHTGLATLAVSQGDLETAERYAAPIVAAGGRFRSRVVCLWALGIVAWVRGDLAEARRLHEEGLRLGHDIGYGNGERFNLSAYARVLRAGGDLDGAATIYHEILDDPSAGAGSDAHVWAFDGLARIAYLRGEVGEARRLATEALELNEQIGYSEGITSALDVLGLVAVAEGDLEGARARLRRAIELGTRMGHRGALVATLEAGAELAMAAGDPDRAARLVGAVEARRSELGEAPEGADPLVGPRLRDDLRARLDDRFEVLRQAGRDLPLEAAIALATERT